MTFMTESLCSFPRWLQLVIVANQLEIKSLFVLTDAVRVGCGGCGIRENLLINWRLWRGKDSRRSLEIVVDAALMTLVGGDVIIVIDDVVDRVLRVHRLTDDFVVARVGILRRVVA